MSTVLVVVIVIVALLVVCAVGFLAYSQARRQSLRKRFGPEYDRAVKNHESTREAEQELLAREKRHHELDIKPLDPDTRERHRTQWRLVQEHFVDAPGTAVVEADHLLVLVMGERGYPTENYEQQAADLSVEHAATVDRYRKAHDISTRAEADKASTEDLRQAMVHYRALFTELVEDGDTATTEETERATARPEPAAEDPAERRTEDAAEADTAADGRPGTEARPRTGEPVDGEAERAETSARAGTGARDEASDAGTRGRGRSAGRRDGDEEPA